jgi:CRP-like cAMP-binding protein
MGEPQKLEGVLAYLPCSRILEHRRRQVIYEPGNPSTGLHVIIDGKVLVQRMAADRVSMLVDIYQTDDLFGETAFIGSAESHEIAIALEPTRVMTWSRDEVDQHMLRRPRLGLALLQMLAKRCVDSARRIVSFASDNIERRLARTLLYMSARLGQESEDGRIQTMSLTHKLLAQHVGTSREVVTYNMNRFRHAGYLSYSRHAIVLDPDAIRKFLKLSD